MKTLTQIIKEELDNNLLYMIDMWLERNDEERQEFIELISKCKTDHIININKLKTKIKKNIAILKKVIANKSKYNKYNK